MKFFKNRHLLKKTLWLLIVSIAVMGLVASGAFAKTTQTSAVKKIESTSSDSTAVSPTTTTTIAIAQISNSSPASNGSFVGSANRIQIGSTFIAYRQFGSGPDLILLNDAGQSMDSWGISLLSDLSASYKVTVIDFPGVGYSTDNLSTPMTIGWIATKISTLLSDLNIKSPILVGAGFGGQVAISMAESSPNLFKYLVLAGTSPGSPSSYQIPVPELQTLFGTSSTYTQKIQLMFPASAQTALNAYMAPTNLLPIEPIPNATLNRQFQAQQVFDQTSQFLNKLPTIKAKCLILVGDKDTIMPEQDSNLLVSGLLNANKVVMTGYGHSIMLQNPTAFLQQLNNFVSS